MEADRLLQLVHEHPDDDGARRLYADWLIEHGDPRGELIALQLARAAGGTKLAVERREADLLFKHGRSWLGPFAKSIGVYRFERGFLAQCELTSVTRAMIGDASWSTVQQVTLRGVDGPQVAPFLSHPVMRSLREVSGVGPLGFMELCMAGRGAGIRKLHVVGVEPIPLARVRSLGGLPQLTELSFA